MRRHSSVVTIVAPRLPLHPGFNGKLLQSSDLLFRSPCRPQRVIAFKVGVSAVSHSTDICRFNLDTSVSTPGSNDPIGTFQIVSRWLRNPIVSQVSHFDVLRLADLCSVYPLDLEPSVSMSWSNESIRMIFETGGWHGQHW